MCLVLPAVPLAGMDVRFEKADPQQMFQVLYGPQAAQVTATPDTSDDLKFAQQILEAAKNPRTSLALREVLCLKSSEFAQRHIDGGSKLSVDALEYLVRQEGINRQDHLPALRQAYESWRRTSGGSDRILAQQGLMKLLIEEGDARIENGAEVADLTEAIRLYEQASSLAGTLGQSATERAAIRHRIADANRQLTVLRRIALAKARLRSSPMDEAAARELLTLYVVELDHPKEARKYTFLTTDPELQKCIIAASSRIPHLKTDEILMLGSWYADLAQRATGDSRLAMYRRAEKYYQIALGRQKDQASDAVKSELERIQTLLRKSQATAEARP